MQLALALYRSGRQAEALRTIQHYKSELADEIGLVPTAALDELEHRILEHDPDLLTPSHRQHVVRDYQLDEVIGEGAFSLVWRGVQPSLDRKVAIKQIMAPDAKAANRGLEEFSRMLELRHELLVLRHELEHALLAL